MFFKTLTLVFACVNLIAALNLQIVNQSGKEALFRTLPTAKSIRIANGKSGNLTLQNTWQGSIVIEPVECETETCRWPKTLAEFSFAIDDYDYYDIALVDGFNSGVKIQSSDKNCDVQSCTKDIMKVCPSDKIVKNKKGDAVACSSSPDVFKTQCPDAVILSSDVDKGSKCKTGSSFTITFGNDK